MDNQPRGVQSSYTISSVLPHSHLCRSLHLAPSSSAPLSTQHATSTPTRPAGTDSVMNSACRVNFWGSGHRGLCCRGFKRPQLLFAPCPTAVVSCSLHLTLGPRNSISKLPRYHYRRTSLYHSICLFFLDAYPNCTIPRTYLPISMLETAPAKLKETDETKGDMSLTAVGW
jgi:hypothetical protein